MAEVSLRELQPGESATVVGYAGDVPPRLLEMGLLPGTVVEMVRRAPLGDPLDLRVRGYHLSIRAHEAAAVRVERPSA